MYPYFHHYFTNWFYRERGYFNFHWKIFGYGITIGFDYLFDGNEDGLVLQVVSPGGRAIMFESSKLDWTYVNESWLR